MSVGPLRICETWAAEPLRQTEPGPFGAAFRYIPHGGMLLIDWIDPATGEPTGKPITVSGAFLRKSVPLE
jgi:hypothetical protein